MSALRGVVSDHWLLFDSDRQIVGCQCGFRADVESDCGWGDSVVRHLFAVALLDAADAATEIHCGYPNNPMVRSVRAVKRWLRERADAAEDGAA